MYTVFRYLVFFLMMGTVISLTHLYLYRRWIKPAQFSERLANAFKIGLVILPVLMVVTIFLSRRLEGEIVTPLAYFGFGYMGFVFIALCISGTIHLVEFIATRAREIVASQKDHDHIDPQRRAVMARGAALLSLVGTTSASAQALNEGAQAPSLVQVDVPIKNLPTALEGFKIVQLSDIHIGPTLRKAFLDSVVDRVNELSPDFVAITGDLVDGSVYQLADHVRPLSRLRSRYGTFFTTGNHEYYSGADSWIKFLTSLDIRVLRNEHLTLIHKDEPIDVVGVDDWTAKNFGGDHGHDVEKAVAGRKPDRIAVLLAHQPRSIKEADRFGIDLVLSGHTHGGQIWPFGFAVKLVQPYLKGLHRHSERTRIYVHRGTGYWGIPMRLGVNAEIAELTLRRDLPA